VEPNLAQISFDGHTKFSVYRRFSDFYWLRDTLEQKYPGFIIPPLPDKTVPLLQNNLSEKFFLSRARSLDYFLAHVAGHAVLSRDVAVKDFLIAEQARFEQVRKPSLSVDSGTPAAVQVVSTATVGLFEKVFDWGQNLGTTLNSTISGAARAGAQRRERDASDDRFDEAQRYVNELEPKIKFVYDTAKQLVEKNQTLSKALHELGLAFTNMGQSEQQNQLSDAVTELGNVCNGREGLSMLVNFQAEKEQIKFLEPIEDYVRLVSAAKQALNMRTKTALAYEYSLGDLTIKRAAREKMAPNDSRIPTADGEIVEAQQRVESAKTDFEMVTDRVLKEVERFKREKSQDFKALILQYVQLQIDHNQAVEQLWKSVLPQLHRVKAPSEHDAAANFTADDV
jgi:sorting nexin-1/2